MPEGGNNNCPAGVRKPFTTREGIERAQKEGADLCSRNGKTYRVPGTGRTTNDRKTLSIDKKISKSVSVLQKQIQVLENLRTSIKTGRVKIEKKLDLKERSIKGLKNILKAKKGHRKQAIKKEYKKIKEYVKKNRKKIVKTGLSESLKKIGSFITGGIFG